MIYIYKIYHKDNDAICYVGKTKQHPEVRLCQHYADRNKRVTCGIGKFMREYPREEFIITTLETCDQEDAREREQYWIEKEGILNSQNAIKNPNYDKEYSKQYKHRTRDKKKHNEKEKEYYRRHRDVILAKKASQRITCDCGMEMTKDHHRRHLKGSYHKYLIDQISVKSLSEPHSDFS